MGRENALWEILEADGKIDLRASLAQCVDNIEIMACHLAWPCYTMETLGTSRKLELIRPKD